MKNLPETRDLSQAEPWAALDLGSNSFHLLVVRPSGGSFFVIERLKEKVQLLSGFSDGRIQPQAAARGLDCLARFAQRLRPIPPDRILVMGTCALREADNAADFIAAAANVLPVPVRVIDGGREAELVYTAVDHHLDRPGAARLVIDIGGGSTEFAWGDAARADGAASATLGCVSSRNRFFDGATDFAAAYRHARRAALAGLDDCLADVPRSPAMQIYGTSGTIQSIQMVLTANGWSSERITADAMSFLERALLDGRWVPGVGMPGLAPDRIDIFPAGVALLAACFEKLDIQALEYVDVSLLHGMMCEAVVTGQEGSLHEDSVRQLAARFAVDDAQAARVERTALALFNQALSAWPEIAEYLELYRWAARLHEIGAQISTRHYHRHGAYIIKHAELPGFADWQKNMLALLIRGHRRSLPGLAFQAFPAAAAAQLQRLVALLRIAVILERSHNDDDSPAVSFAVADRRLDLTLPPGWLEAHPLSARELEVERDQLEGGGFVLSTG